MDAIPKPEEHDTNIAVVCDYSDTWAGAVEGGFALSELRLLLAVVEAHCLTDSIDDGLDKICDAIAAIKEQAPHLILAARKAGETT